MFSAGFETGQEKLVRGLAALVLATLCAAPALAQGAAPPQAPVRMEFDAVIQQAIDKNPTVARAATNIRRAETLLQQARAVTLPLVTATLQNTTLDSARSFSSGTFQPQNQSVVSGSVGMPILAASRWAAVTQARDQVEVSTASAAEIRQQIVVAAAEAYLSVISARRQVEVAQLALDSARAHLDYAQKRLEGGAGSRLNQLRAAQQASSDEARLEAVKFSLRQSQEALGVVIAADGPIDAGAEPNFDQPGVMGEDAWRTARPDLITQSAIQRAAERVVRDSWRDFVPVVHASFDPIYITPSSIFQPAGTWRFSLTSIYPIFEGGQRVIAKRQREIALTDAKLQLTDLEIQARSEVRLAQEAVLSRERAFASARRAAEQAAEVVTITTSAFQVGATTNLEVIDAQRVARDTDAVAVIAEDAVRRAKLDLLVALGRFK